MTKIRSARILLCGVLVCAVIPLRAQDTPDPALSTDAVPNAPVLSPDQTTPPQILSPDAVSNDSALSPDQTTPPQILSPDAVGSDPVLAPDAGRNDPARSPN
jgi:hypothetical protein